MSTIIHKKITFTQVVTCFLYYISDLIHPTLSNVNDVTIECGASVSPDALGQPLASDNYDLNPELTYHDVLLPQCRVGRDWTAIDSAGNYYTERQVSELR